MIQMEALNTDSWREKGITPVIAIVLLVMMTVGAAVGTWTFIQNIQEDIQDDITQQTGISLATRGTITCSGDAFNATVENTGTTNIEASPTNVFVYDTSGDVAARKDEADLSGNNWTNAGGVGILEVTGLSESLSSNNYYTIELRFVRQDYSWQMGRCLAQ